MRRKLLLLLLVVLLFTVFPAVAQENASGWTTYTLNIRTGPGTNYPSLGKLTPDTPLIVEAHNTDLSWLLVHTVDQSKRGWVAALYVRFQSGFTPAALPGSEEILSAPSVANLSVASNAAQTLMSIPLIPSISGQARSIFQGSGNDPHAFIKIGDCNSEYVEFLGPLDAGSYDLGSYSNLQPTIDFFRGSWGSTYVTAHGGFTVLAVLDPMWTANIPACMPDESPLACELRARRPAVAVMMFGPNDVAHLTAEQFENAVRQVVDITIANGTIPVLTTFTWCNTGEHGEKGLQFNLITANIAQEYRIPLINFWRGAQALPNCGLLDETHLSKPVMTSSGNFNGEEQLTGQTLRNLLTLQTLDAIRAAALRQ